MRSPCGVMPHAVVNGKATPRSAAEAAARERALGVVRKAWRSDAGLDAMAGSLLHSARETLGLEVTTLVLYRQQRQGLESLLSGAIAERNAAKAQAAHWKKRVSALKEKLDGHLPSKDAQRLKRQLKVAELSASSFDKTASDLEERVKEMQRSKQKLLEALREFDPPSQVAGCAEGGRPMRTLLERVDVFTKPLSDRLLRIEPPTSSTEPALPLSFFFDSPPPAGAGAAQTANTRGQSSSPHDAVAQRGFGGLVAAAGLATGPPASATPMILDTIGGSKEQLGALRAEHGVVGHGAVAGDCFPFESLLKTSHGGSMSRCSGHNGLKPVGRIATFRKKEQFILVAFRGSRPSPD